MLIAVILFAAGFLTTYAKGNSFQDCLISGDGKVTISGVVKDETGQPLPGASVVVKGTTTGVVTNSDGSFTIEVEKDAPLEVSFLSFKSESFVASVSKRVIIVLKEDKSLLDESVVVGYGSQSRKTLTSSITTVKSEILQDAPVTSMGEALKGRVPGMYAASNSTIPGDSPRYLIRGGSSINLSNDPIVIVDGVNRSMSDIDPNDIESIEVLKDAASAGIYGARASNGVILVTTKKGKASKGPEITFNAMVGMENAVDKWNLMNSTQFVKFLRPYLVNGYNGASIMTGATAAGTGNTSSTAIYTTRYLNDGEIIPSGYLSMKDPVDPSKTLIYTDTDYQDQWFQKASWQKYYIGVNGGNDKMKYVASLSSLDDGGVVKMTEYKQMSMHSNVTFKVTDKLEASSTFDFSKTTNDQLYPSNWNVLGRSLLIAPTRREYNDEGYITTGGSTTWMQSPLWWSKAYNFDNLVTHFSGILNLKWTIFDGLVANVQYGLYDSNTLYSMYQYLNAGGVKNYLGTTHGVQESRTNLIRDVFTAYLNYKKTINGIHNFNVMGGYDYSKWRNRYLFAKSTGYTSDKVPILDSGTTFTASNTDTEEALISYYARLNYDYMEKYLVSGTVRADGSSKFSSGHQWGFFPSASLAWVVSKEGFWDDMKNHVNFLKIRASYGLTGNNGIGLYDAYGAYTTSNLYDGSSVTIASSMLNKDLTWEKTAQLDFGFDMNFLNDRIRMTADYYDKVTSDMLFSVTLPDTGSFDSVKANVGSARFYGVEFSIHSVNIDHHDFSWSTDLAYSYGANKVISLDDSYKYTDINGKEAWRIGGYTLTQSGYRFGGIAVGEPLGRIYGYKIDHIIQNEEDADNAFYDALSKGYRDSDGQRITGRKAPGDYEWKNREGSALTADGKEMINAEDMFELGNVLPKHTGSIGNTFRYKRLSLNIFCDFALGHSIVNEFKCRVFENTYGACNGNIVTDVYDCWTPENTNAKYARFSPNDNDYQNSNFGRISDFCVEKGDYLCIRDVSLYYDLPERISSKMRMKKVSLGITGNTLYYFDNVSGTISPEIGIGTSSSSSWFSPVSSSDNTSSNLAPAARKILFNVKITF